jgi:peptide/nickel transport system substrate-binding protein
LARALRSLGWLTSIVVLAGACTAGETTHSRPPEPSSRLERGGTLDVVLEDPIAELDPLRSALVSDRDVQHQIYDSLVGIDPAGNVTPWLAQSWTFSEANTVLTLALRNGVKYHDGTTFDAESVKWNLERYKTGKGSLRVGELAPVTAIDVLDPTTVRLKLSAPFPSLLPNLVDRAGMMLSRRAVEAGGEDFARRPFRAGTGPFILTEAIKDDRVVVDRNPDWWRRDRDGNALPYLDRVTYRSIKDGDVRIANIRTDAVQVASRVNGKDVPQVRADPSLRYQEIPGYSFGSLVPNRAPGFTFNEGRYVKAVAMAIDRKELLAGFVGLGVVGYGAIAPPHFAFDDSFRPYETPDPVAAKKLVEDVGRGRLRFELLMQSGDPAMLQIGLLIQSQLARADITADLRSLSVGEILNVQNERTFSGMTLFGWSGRIDPDGNTYEHLRTGGASNWSSYSNPQVDRLLDEQRATLDVSRRRAALRAAERIYVLEDPARIWYRFGAVQLLTTKKVQGLEPYADGIMRTHSAWLRK